MLNSHSVGWQNGQWLPLADIRLSVDDLGCLQGVMVVDRLRTVGGRPLDAVQHVQRWSSGCRQLGFDVTTSGLTSELILELAERNLESIAGDCGIVLLGTPGRAGVNAGKEPTVIAHATSIPWKSLRHYYEHGQPLQIVAQQIVPDACWPLQVKNRARINYYVADAVARQTLHDPLAAGLLVAPSNSGELCLAETSSANVLLIERDGGGLRLVSPPETQSLNGLSLQRTIRLATALGIRVERQELPLDRGLGGVALLLTGSTGCLWRARSLNDRLYQPTREADELWQLLREAWVVDIGLDFVAQATKLGAS